MSSINYAYIMSALDGILKRHPTFAEWQDAIAQLEKDFPNWSTGDDMKNQAELANASIDALRTNCEIEQETFEQDQDTIKRLSELLESSRTIALSNAELIIRLDKSITELTTEIIRCKEKLQVEKLAEAERVTQRDIHTIDYLARYHNFPSMAGVLIEAIRAAQTKEREK